MNTSAAESATEKNGSVEHVEATPAAPPAEEARPATSQRLQSLDVYRGLIMVTLAFAGFGLAQTAQQHLKGSGNSAFWSAVHYQFEHVEWVGCGYWDLIQPSFMFMVGVSMAYSYVKRARAGQSYLRMFGHAAWRSVVLVLLGIFLISNWKPTPEMSLMNVLSQIGLGYALLFLLWGRTWQTQAKVAAALLVGVWLLYVTYPMYGHAGIDLATGNPSVGVTHAWAQENLEGISPAWHKSANVGQAIDLVFLNWLPRDQPYVFNKGGYQTINFLPSLATMIFGLMCGELLRSKRSHADKLKVLVIAGLAGIAAGQLLNLTGVCPLVKRIWTPSWTLFSTGWCCLILAALYAIIDVLGYQRWSFPLLVVGMNSIAIYCMGQLLKPWMRDTLKRYFGPEVFLMWGKLYEPMLQATFIGLCFWLACYWMYRQKIFIRI
ncbi:MAG: acyltransferase family protein [Gemmataceae bacterium]